MSDFHSSDFHNYKTVESSGPAYMKSVLIAAGIYNLIWGGIVILFPGLAFNLVGIELPRYPQIWQCVGMIVGVYGIGYLIAAGNPLRHWPIVFVGLAGKIFGPVGYFYAALQGDFPWSWGAIILLNDLIWWIPFAAILFEAFKFHADTSIGNPHEIEDATIIFPSSRGRTLAELSHERPLMVVFLRHLGCTFCREALQDLARSRKQVEDLGLSIALVHMSHPKKAERMMENYELNDVDQFCDGTCEMYRAFGVHRGTFWQLFGPKVVWRAIAATIKGNFAGALAGDGFRMPAIFFLHEGEILGSFRHRNASDRPNYVELARQFRTTIEKDANSVSA